MSRFPEELVTGLCEAILGRRQSSRPTLIAVDGPGCSGKSSLTEQLCAAIGEPTTDLGTDAFFAPFRAKQETWSPDEDLSPGIPHLRWSELETLVLDVLPSGRAGSYRPYDWSQDALGPEVAVPAAQFVVIEGLYALHPRLRRAYDYRVWVDSRCDDRMQRVVRRDGTELIPLWDAIYVPREQAYIARHRPYAVADLFVLGAALDGLGTRHTFAWKAETGQE